MSVRSKSALPTADMQWRARKLALQAAKFADQAGPMTRKAAVTARKTAGGAASWARPKVGRARAWTAVRAARGSVSVQERFAPRVSSMLAAAARRLDPPPPRSRRWPKVLAGAAVLAAGAAAATAMAIRNRPGGKLAPPPVRSRPGSERTGAVLNPSAEADQSRAEAEVNGLSRTR